MAGPEVILKLTPISFAIISARQVLPSPGGPDNRTWSSGSFLFLAELINIARFSIIVFCPIKSLIYLGLKLLSSSISSLLSLTSTSLSALSLILLSLFLLSLLMILCLL